MRFHTKKSHFCIVFIQALHPEASLPQIPEQFPWLQNKDAPFDSADIPELIHAPQPKSLLRPQKQVQTAILFEYKLQAVHR